MAKKKAGKKPAAKKAKVAKKREAKRATRGGGRWTAPGAKQRAAEAKTATKAPKQAPLISGLRIRSLDNVCGHISDTRAAIARLQGEEADLEKHAHDLMKKHDRQTWQASGVVLVRVPGEEKLTVKTVRNRPPAATAEDETEQENPPVDYPGMTIADEGPDGVDRSFIGAAVNDGSDQE